MSRAGETVWEVFARKEYAEPLHHVGHRDRIRRRPGGGLGARDLRRAAVDRDDHRPASARSGRRSGHERRSGAVDAATATMISLIGSLADNKSALGRRYGEWAVSAPTIESAVAAAAMAQDELGHARSTYPVLAKLGVERSDSGLDTGHPMFVISQELPDWASVIAANLVVDGVLTTFVASARDSSIEPLAQRARKILQEEGAHRIHAEAWARRIVATGGEDLRVAASARRRDVGGGGALARAGLGPRLPGGDRRGDGRFGPGCDPAPRARLALPRIAGVSLDEPSDWSDWDAQHRR